MPITTVPKALLGASARPWAARTAVGTVSG